jgi:hypothetical protein
MMSLFRWLAERKQRAEAARYEEMRHLSDNFGWGPILRYGEDRYGAPTQPNGDRQ